MGNCYVGCVWYLWYFVVGVEYGGVFYLVVGIVVLVYLFFDNLVCLLVGDMLCVICEDEVLVVLFGVNGVVWKVFVFGFGVAIVGLVGIFYFGFVGMLVFDVFGIIEFFIMMVMVIVGGMGIMIGLVIGVIVFMFLFEFLCGFGELCFMIYGFAFMLVVFFMLGGIV